VVIVVISLLVLLAYLVWERLELSRTRRRIPLVIAITGTRGKSSVARTLGAVLRESGRRVLVKTTGTEAQYVLPDGSSEDIVRRGPPSVLEQKRVLRKAVRSGADVLIAEMMSIEPANHVVESRAILRPSIVVITNIRKDHTESMGETLTDIAETIMLDVVGGAQVFVPQAQVHLFPKATGAGWNVVAAAGTGDSDRLPPSPERFPDNERLVAAVARSLGVSADAIRRGCERVRTDRGGFTMWRRTYRMSTVYLVNAFAANDPESTGELLLRAREIAGRDKKLYGMFALRADRATRTLQWIEALESEPWSLFEKIFLVGDVPRTVSRRIKQSMVLRGEDPEIITESALSLMTAGGILFGFGNTHGIGLPLIDHWRKEGLSHGT